jgi:HD-GYP domain-containing protein (c-di-GMP phosphodiesterase class II)
VAKLRSDSQPASAFESASGAGNTALNEGQVRVYCQSSRLRAALKKSKPNWRVTPFPKDLTRATSAAVAIVEDKSMVWDQMRVKIDGNLLRIIFLLGADRKVPRGASGVPIFAFLTPPAEVAKMIGLIEGAIDNLFSARRQAGLEREIERAHHEIDQLNEIGIALSTERDRGALLSLILRKCREITQSDAGSLYLVEEDDRGARRLRFAVTQNDSLPPPVSDTIMPLDRSSIAGYVALTGEEIALADVYHILPSVPFHFNREFDEEHGYRSKSMLAVPMKNPQGEICGVVQLINCKRDMALHVNGQSAGEIIVPFPDRCRSMLRSLASQAAVALENNRLYESIETLFEGFVRASVSAIEARDPTTSGHSFRVADLTLGLAQAVDRADSAAFRDIRFNRAEMKEIRYASLLHDFGKVGVREEVLVKAKKLYPGQLELIKQRFAYARKALEHEQSERKLAYLLEKGRADFLSQQAEFQRELETELMQVDELLECILRSNEPTVLPGGNFARLTDLAAYQFTDSSGRLRPLLAPQEVRLLSIDQGSLDEEERLQIQSHVNHTQNFLQKIPWTKEIKNIPAIASAHHEKLDGTGYPYSLASSQIPLQSKMMTIADIYDALSATDRPYKKAVPWERALDILHSEANRGLIDGELLRLFREAEIFRLATHSKPN